MSGETHARLRAATREDHERLETRLDILNRITSADGRRELLLRFWRLHSELEASAAPWLAELPDLEFEARRRTAVLSRDLAILGLEPPASGAGPQAAGPGEALGLMYVLEGSTLGGRVIRRHVESGGGDMAGLSFLDPYGAEAGVRWRGFLAVLERVARAPGQASAAVAGALAGFRHAELTLCEPA